MTQAKPLCCDTDAERPFGQPALVSDGADAHDTMSNFDQAQFGIPFEGVGEVVVLQVVKPGLGISRHRLIWRLEDEFGYRDHGHISSHESERSARIKLSKVRDWLNHRDAHPIAPGVTGEGGQ